VGKIKEKVRKRMKWKPQKERNQETTRKEEKKLHKERKKLV
jgi:hypothetical protein